MPSTWTMAASGPLVHVTGNTTTVTATLTEAPIITTPTTYKITITGTQTTGGTAAYTFGGVSGTTIAATAGAFTNTDYITALNTTSLIITPASACVVSISAITIEKLTDATGDLTVEGKLIAHSSLKLENGNITYPSLYSITAAGVFGFFGIIQPVLYS